MFRVVPLFRKQCASAGRRGLPVDALLDSSRVPWRLHFDKGRCFALDPSQASSHRRVDLHASERNIAVGVLACYEQAFDAELLLEKPAEDVARSRAFQSFDVGHIFAVGADESGYGGLAGPVVCAACWIPPGVNVPHLRDSKLFPSDASRMAVFHAVTGHPLIRWAVFGYHAPVMREGTMKIFDVKQNALSAAVRNILELIRRPQHLGAPSNSRDGCCPAPLPSPPRILDPLTAVIPQYFTDPPVSFAVTSKDVWDRNHRPAAAAAMVPLGANRKSSCRTAVVLVDGGGTSSVPNDLLRDFGVHCKQISASNVVTLDHRPESADNLTIATNYGEALPASPCLSSLSGSDSLPVDDRADDSRPTSPPAPGDDIEDVEPTCRRDNVVIRPSTPHLPLDDHRDGIYVYLAAVCQSERKSASCAAASVIAHTMRNHYMDRLHQAYPAYGFDSHRGYATASHKTAIARHGGIEGVHRSSGAR